MNLRESEARELQRIVDTGCGTRGHGALRGRLIRRGLMWLERDDDGWPVAYRVTDAGREALREHARRGDA